MSYKEIQEKLEAATRKLVYDYSVQIEKLTEEQVANALRQAIECGDFQRYVCEGSHRQAVVYIPFAREQELLNRIKELESPEHEELLTRNLRMKIQKLIEVITEAKPFLQSIAAFDPDLKKLLLRLEGYKL